MVSSKAFGTIVCAFDLRHEQSIQPAYVTGIHNGRISSVILNLNEPGKRQVVYGDAINRYVFYGVPR